jgi:hypothetical protein
MDRKKTLQSYNSEEIYQVLYHSNIPKTLWGNERRETEQLFIDHSVGTLTMFQIPLIWIPIIRKLLLALVEIDPDIHFFQVREQSGELSLLTRPSHTCEPLIRQMLFAAKRAIDTVTLIQLRLLDEAKHDMS